MLAAPIQTLPGQRRASAAGPSLLWDQGNWAAAARALMVVARSESVAARLPAVRRRSNDEIRCPVLVLREARVLEPNLQRTHALKSRGQ